MDFWNQISVQVASCYPELTADFATDISNLLDKHYAILNTSLRQTLVKALILLRNRKQVSVNIHPPPLSNADGKPSSCSGIASNPPPLPGVQQKLRMHTVWAMTSGKRDLRCTPHFIALARGDTAVRHSIFF